MILQKGENVSDKALDFRREICNILNTNIFRKTRIM